MKIIGHRGARGLAPENTIASLQKALEHLKWGVDQIEFDVRVTKDGVPILHHNKWLRDPNDQKHRIASYSYQELKERKADLATLDEAMNVIDAKVSVCIEVKPGELVKPIIKLLQEGYINKLFSADQILLGSKSQKTLLALHKALPDIQKVVIEPWSGVRASYRARQLGTKYISMNQLWLWSGFIRAVSRRGYHLYAYTLNDPIKAKRWGSHGLYGVITDYPNHFKT